MNKKFNLEETVQNCVRLGNRETPRSIPLTFFSLRFF